MIWNNMSYSKSLGASEEPGQKFSSWTKLVVFCDIALNNKTECKICTVWNALYFWYFFFYFIVFWISFSVYLFYTCFQSVQIVCLWKSSFKVHITSLAKWGHLIFFFFFAVHYGAFILVYAAFMYLQFYIL